MKIVYRDGTSKVVPAASAWEYENDPDWLRTEPDLLAAALALIAEDDGTNQHRCDWRCERDSVEVAQGVPPCVGQKFRDALTSERANGPTSPPASPEWQGWTEHRHPTNVSCPLCPTSPPAEPTPDDMTDDEWARAHPTGPEQP